VARDVPRQRRESVRAGRRPQRQGRLERENARLKSLVGELALELKKSEEVLG
jgi:hypothetical protein